MERTARLFLCARCRDQVVLCAHCNRGQQYCGRGCARDSRCQRRHEAAARYQRSPMGRRKHEARSARWRARQRSLRRIGAEGHVNKVTHQGCLVEAAAIHRT